MGLVASCTYQPLASSGSTAPVTTRLRATARAEASKASAWPSRSSVSIWRTYSQPAIGSASVHSATSSSFLRRLIGRLAAMQVSVCHHGADLRLADLSPR